MQHVFIIGAKSLGSYGGYETFVYKLTEYHQNNEKIKYHIACKANGSGCMDESKLEGISRISNDEFVFHNAHCFKIKVPKIGSAQAIWYDLSAINYSCKYIQKHKIKNAVIYILACRIGPFMLYYAKMIHGLGGKIFVNPDGHEWKRAKWNALIRKYWKMSEQLMVKHSDVMVCDSKAIQNYICKEYARYNPRTKYIAYGADIVPSVLADDDPKFAGWMAERELAPYDYYLIVGRFVPENNYEIMIREFMKSNTKRSLVIITNQNGRFAEKLDERLHFKSDDRIRFVGTIYDQELLKKIRENAYAYLHGHEVGGTNPSLLEALSCTKINLLLDVTFNRECGEDGALYWNKEDGSLASLIEQTELLSGEEIKHLGTRAKQRIKNAYRWEYIAAEYEKVLL